MSDSNTIEHVASIVDDAGNQVPLTAEQFGNYVAKNYGTYNFMFKQSFFDYHDSHIMNDVRAKLKAGLDEVSCDYIDRFEYLLYFQRVQGQALLRTDMFWTEVDKALLERNREWVARGEPAFLQQVNQDWSTSYTNFYGMYDVLPIKTKVPLSSLAQIERLKPLQADADGMVEVNYQDRINGKAVIDAGGFVGDTIFLFRDLFYSSKIHSFEPVKKNFAYLTTYVEADIKSGRVIPVNKGLGDKAGILRFSGSRQDADATASSANDYGQEELYEEAEVTTIDLYAQENNLDVGIIKVDVEGFEPEIIKGAVQTIRSQRPLLVIAIYHNAPEFYELKSFIESLNLGYKFAIRRSNLCVPSTDLVLVAYPD